MKIFYAFDFKNSFFETVIQAKINLSNYKNIKSHKFYLNANKVKIFEKSELKSIKYGSIVKIYQGIIIGDNIKFMSSRPIDKSYVKIYRGKDISSYGCVFSENYLLFEKEQLRIIPTN